MTGKQSGMNPEVREKLIQHGMNPNLVQIRMNPEVHTAGTDADWSLGADRVSLARAIDNYLCMISAVEDAERAVKVIGDDIESSFGLSRWKNRGWLGPVWSLANAFIDSINIHIDSKLREDAPEDAREYQELLKERMSAGEYKIEPLIGEYVKQMRDGLCSPNGLTYVNEEVMNLISVAASSLEDCVMFKSDLIAPEGVIYFEVPLVHPVPIYGGFKKTWGGFKESEDEQEVIEKSMVAQTYRAISWATREETFSHNGKTHHAYGLVFTLYGGGEDHPYTFILYEPEYNEGGVQPISFTSESSSDGSWEVSSHFMKFFLSLMRFCWQEITVSRKIERADLPRANWRRIERERGGIEANIIYLRRQRNKRTDEGDTIGMGTLEFQSLTRGHWRNQYYPSLGVVGDPNSYRTIWINPYVRGPEGAPFRRSPKVTAVVR